MGGKLVRINKISNEMDKHHGRERGRERREREGE